MLIADLPVGPASSQAESMVAEPVIAQTAAWHYDLLSSDPGPGYSSQPEGLPAKQINPLEASVRQFIVVVEVLSRCRNQILA